MFVMDKDGDYVFHGIEDEAERLTKLPAGVYRFGRSQSMMGATTYFKPVAVTQDGVINLRTTVARNVRNEIKSFFDQATRQRLAAAGVKNRRGIILHGPPGTGKTSLVRSMFPLMVKHDAVILLEPPVNMMTGIIQEILYFGGQKRDIVMYFDEFDQFSSGAYDVLKQVLDGLTSPDNLLTIGCTNNLDAIPEALVQRPSRFSLVTEMPKPSPAVRAAFMRQKFPMIPVEIAEALTEMIADKPLDYVQEVCTLHLRGMDLDEIRDRMQGVPPVALVLDGDAEDDYDLDDENRY